MVFWRLPIFAIIPVYIKVNIQEVSCGVDEPARNRMLVEGVEQTGRGREGAWLEWGARQQQGWGRGWSWPHFHRLTCDSGKLELPVSGS